MAQDEDLAFQRSLWEHRTAPSRTPSTRPQGLLAASNHSSGSILFIDEIYVVPSSRHGHPPPTSPCSIPHSGGTHVGTAMIRALVESHPHALFIHLITPCAPHPDQNGAISFFERLGFTPAKSSTHLFEIDPTVHVYLSVARHLFLSRSTPILSFPSTTHPPLLYFFPSPQPNDTRDNSYHPDIVDLLGQAKSWHLTRRHGSAIGDQMDPWDIVRLAHIFCVAYPHDVHAYATYIRSHQPSPRGGSLLLPPPVSCTPPLPGRASPPPQQASQQDTSASIDAVLNSNPAGSHADIHACVYLAPTHTPPGDG